MAHNLNLTTDLFDFNTTDLFNTSTPSPNNTVGNGTQTTMPGLGGVPFIPWDNPRNIISKEAADSITNTFQCYIFPILTVVGIVGNVCSLIVLLQKKMRSSTTSLVLIGLALSDLLFLATNFVRKSECIVEKYDPHLADVISAETFYYMHYLKTSFSRTSTVLVCLISVERVIAVGFPFKAKMWITKTRMLIAVVFCYVFTFGCLAGYPPQYTYVYYGKKPFIAYTDFYYENEESLKFYNEYFLPIGFRHIPVVVVFVLNTIIIILLKRSKGFQKKTASQDTKRKDDQKKITRMLLTVAIVYLICLLPGDVFLRCAIEITDFQFFQTYHNLFMALSDICLFFEMTNSCINFVIYMVLNKNFFDEYVRLFCCCTTSERIRQIFKSTSSVKTKVTNVKSDSKIEMPEGSSSVVVKEDPDPTSEKAGEVNEAYIENP